MRNSKSERKIRKNSSGIKSADSTPRLSHSHSFNNKFKKVKSASNVRDVELQYPEIIKFAKKKNKRKKH